MPPLWVTALIGFLLCLMTVVYIDSIRVVPSECLIVITKSSITIRSCKQIPDLSELKTFNLSGVDCTL
uniref:Movement protein TGBp3 n=1 Tax=Sweet potato chlorotic fleck virus TaxID=263004 RepID=A0A0D3RLV3_9VIRU|nr:triple gene block protein 3 [Sweet potato chlorotic fleck virus]